MKKKTLIRAISLLMAVSLTAGCSSSQSETSADTEAASAASESSAVLSDETISETSPETESSESEASAEDDIIEKREDYADGWYSIFRYDSADKNIISADCFNSDDERILAVEYKYKEDEVLRSVLLSDSTAVDFSQTYDMTRLDKNHKGSLSSKLISTAKDMSEGQELTTVTDDNGVLTEAYYSTTLDDGTEKKTEQWVFSGETVIYHSDGKLETQYDYDDSGRLTTELVNGAVGTGNENAVQMVEHTYEFNEFGDVSKRTMTRISFDSDDSDEFTTEYTYRYDADNKPVYTYEATEYFGETVDRLTGSEYDENGLPMRCIIHGELTDNYISLVYASNPGFIDHYFYVPNYDGTARIDELHISLQCENS